MFVAAAIPPGVLITAILVVNNLRDIPTDTAAGKRTLAVVLGKRRTQAEYGVLLGIAYAVPVLLAVAWVLGARPAGEPWALAFATTLPLLTLPMAPPAAADRGDVRRAAGAQPRPQGDGAPVARVRAAVRGRAGRGRGARGMTAALGVRRVRVPFRVPFETAAGHVGRPRVAARGDPLRGGRARDREAPIDASLRTAALTTYVQALLEGPGDGVPDDVRHAFASGLGGAVLDLAPPPEPVATAIRAGVGVNATLPVDGIDETVVAAAAAVGAGYRTLKLKAGGAERASTLVDRVRAVRQAVGPRVAIRLDANGSWDLEGALERLRALEPIGIQYVEQPLPVGARGGAAQLREQTGVPIAADEAVTSPEAALALVEHGAADVLVVKPARVGGPGAAAAISAVAAQAGVPVVISSLFETGIGLAAAVACAAALPDVPGWPAGERDHGLATADVLVHDLLLVPLVIADGRIRASFLPGSGGLGIAVDESAVERFAVDDA